MKKSEMLELLKHLQHELARLQLQIHDSVPCPYAGRLEEECAVNRNLQDRIALLESMVPRKTKRAKR